jgi:hypothetical protein
MWDIAEASGCGIGQKGLNTQVKILTKLQMHYAALKFNATVRQEPRWRDAAWSA